MCRHCLGQIRLWPQLIFAKICTRVKNLGAIRCVSGNADVQWNNINKCVLDTVSDLVGKFENRERKPWIKQDMISKMGERRKWKNVDTEESRKNYRRLRKELKGATGNAKKEYLENIRKKIMEFQRTGLYDLMYMKTKELGWKETQRVPTYWHWRLTRE